MDRTGAALGRRIHVVSRARLQLHLDPSFVAPVEHLVAARREDVGDEDRVVVEPRIFGGTARANPAIWHGA